MWEIWSATAASQLFNVTVTSTPTSGGYDQTLTVVAYQGAIGGNIGAQLFCCQCKRCGAGIAHHDRVKLACLRGRFRFLRQPIEYLVTRPGQESLATGHSPTTWPGCSLKSAPVPSPDTLANLTSTGLSSDAGSGGGRDRRQPGFSECQRRCHRPDPYVGIASVEGQVTGPSTIMGTSTHSVRPTTSMVHRLASASTCQTSWALPLPQTLVATGLLERMVVSSRSVTQCFMARWEAFI